MSRISCFEPLGILSGPAARQAIAAGTARPLGGGPLAFTLVRLPGESVAMPVAGFSGSLDALTEPCTHWAALPSGPHVMGIVNVTPDSFSDGGRTFQHQRAIDQGRHMLDDGACILDIGGESTRPGAKPVTADEEQRRIMPVVEALARSGALVSVDTRHASTMAMALDAGATVINDVSGLRHDTHAARLLAERDCPIILMHMRGDPRTMNSLTAYGDVARDVLAELGEAVAAAESAGIVRERIAVDPGFGFAKTASQSRELLERLPLFVNLRCPIIAGLSRKKFVGEMAGVAAPEERDAASVAAALVALSLGATVIRAHAVKATVQAVRVWQSVQG